MPSRMDELHAASTPSVYHSARETSESSSPDTFRTPFSTLHTTELDISTPRTTAPATSLALQTLLEAHSLIPSPSSSPILERYIQSFGLPRTEVISLTPSTQMPVSTRLRERKQASQCSSTVSSPARTMSSSTIQADAPPSATSEGKSPMTTIDLLRDISPKSPSYASQLEKAVDGLVHSLMHRGRVREGHGLRELYTQSLKDSGSAQLLDALLRQKANERQKQDFERYVEDVNRLSNQQPVVMIPLKTTMPIERSMPIRSIGNNCVGGSNNTAEPLPTNGNPLSPRVVIQVSSPAIIQTSEIKTSHPSRPTDPVEYTPENPNKYMPDQSAAFSWRLRTKSTSHNNVQNPHGLSGISEEHDDISAMNIPAIENQRFGVGIEAKEMIRQGQEAVQRSIMNNHNQLVSTELLSVQYLRARRRKKSRNKMFLGANGPVYSANILFGPRGKTDRL